MSGDHNQYQKPEGYSDYETQRSILIQYMHVMIARNDWHGVSDAANDLRELEAEEKNK
jgi:hypothetical protein